MKFRPASPGTNQKPIASSKLRFGRIALALVAGAAVLGRMAGTGPKARTGRREPDAATSKMFSNIHHNRERFTASAVSKALAKAKAAKVD